MSVRTEDTANGTSFELKPFRRHPPKPQSWTGDSATDDHDDFHFQQMSPTRLSHSASSSSTVHSYELYTPDEERAVVRKLDRNVVLFMSLLYLLSFLDRSNIGNARLGRLIEDLGIDDGQFEWLLTGFYITYILFEWMIMLYHYLQPHVYISCCVLSWGLVASLQALTRSFPEMLILRLLLGVGEAAFSPGVPFYLSFFYRREELAMRAGMQVSAAPLAASFAGSLAYVIMRWGEGGPLAPWRLLFLVEGFPSVIVAVIAWSYVPDSPETAKFLTERQRYIARARLHDENTSFTQDRNPANQGEKRERVHWKEIYATLRDPKCYLTALMFLNCNIAFSSMPVFLPAIVHAMGYSSISSQGLSAPPFLVAFCAVLLTAKLSDKYATRSPFVCFHALLAFSGYAVIAIGGYFRWSDMLRYLCVYPAAAGFFSAITIIITWTMNLQESQERKGMGMTILNLIGQTGPLLGTRLYPERDEPYYVWGMTVCASAMLLVFLLSMVLRLVLIRENRRRALENGGDATADDFDDDAGELLARGKGPARSLRNLMLML